MFNQNPGSFCGDDRVDLADPNRMLERARNRAEDHYTGDEEAARGAEQAAEAAAERKATARRAREGTRGHWESGFTAGGQAASVVHKMTTTKRMRRASISISRRRVLLSATATAMLSILTACARTRPSTDPSSVSPPQASTATGTGVATAVPPSFIAPGATFPPPVGATVSTREAPSAAVAWMRDNAIRFATAEPNDDFSDLQLLKQLIGDARIVSLGEATHGTHEFQTMKHRLVRFLVAEMGFTTFAMEANLPESDRVNDYVQAGVGDLKQLLLGLHFWTWNTEEVRDMVEWMRAHNANPGPAPRVSFRGFDMQYIDAAADNVLTYLRRVDPAAAASAASRYTVLSLPHQKQSPLAPLESAPAGTREVYLADANALHDDLGAARSRYEVASSPDAFADALRNARVMVQGVDSLMALGRKEYGRRDRYMAENAAWLLDRAGPDAKMILWAHNGHISTVPVATDAKGMPNETMGMWLRAQYGTAMRVVGQTFYAGTCNASEGIVTEVTVPPPPADSYEAAFHGTGLPRAIVDLRAARPGAEATTWLDGPHPTHFIGAGYDEAAPEKYFENMRLARVFDAVIFIQDSTPTKLLPSI